MTVQEWIDAYGAAWRAADLALPAIQPGRSLRFALLPEGQDPDDLVKAGGAEAFRAVLAEARPLADLLWSRETGGGVFDLHIRVLANKIE